MKPTLAQARKLEEMIAQVRNLGKETGLISSSYFTYLESMERAVSRLYHKLNNPTQGE